MKKVKFWILVCSFAFWILNLFCAYAQDNQRLANLTKEIIEAKANAELYRPFEELKDLYFKEHKYNEFVDSLNSLSQKKKTPEPFINYYTALSRYQQLKYLEETQDWDEYFSQGNTYRDQITQGAQKAIDSTTAKDTLNIYSRLILWRFHKDQQDAFCESALADLMNGTSAYAQETKELAPIKEVADQLLTYGEKGKSKELYKIYVNKLLTSDIKEEDLVRFALNFYKEGNAELSQTVYDAYLERIIKTYPKEKLIPILIDVAKKFSYKDEGLKDPIYAEKVFGKLEDIGTKDAFDEELLYLRAFNLEKAKDYPKAKDIYIDLVKRYSKSGYADEANFKVGMIYTYILRDPETGRDYFANLAQKETVSAQSISSLYQLGLLSQWENDATKAKEYYDKLIQTAKDDFKETVDLAKERIKEVEEAKPLEYNLKTFLDASLGKDSSMFDMSKVELVSYPYRAKKNQSVNISAFPYLSESGCLQVELQYLWSGNLGNTKPTLGQSNFEAAYIDKGTKVIYLVVVSSSGIIDRSIDLVDIY